MNTFSSLAAVLGLWLAVSFALWLAYRILRRRDGSKLARIASAPVALIDEGAAILAALRTRASLSPNAHGSYRLSVSVEEDLREDVRHLLNAIEAQSSYFDRVNTARKRIQATFGLPDFPALSEILQIRRDLWAASEIFLMDDIAALGPELADPKSLASFKAEARHLLFKDETLPASQANDPVALRLAIAREEALAFSTEIGREISARLEKSRFPTPAELVAVPWALVKGLLGFAREVRHLIGDAAITARSLARVVTSKGLKSAADELRRVRVEMPERFAAAFERAGGLARQGGHNLKRHYEFVLEAQELRARYAEFLARAPELSERGRQFLARLEIERRAEEFRETSGDLVHWARQAVVVAIARLIALLQHVQAKITPRTSKQLTPFPGAAPAAAAVSSTPAPRQTHLPLRALLLPSSAYAAPSPSADTAGGERVGERGTAGDLARTADPRVRDRVGGGSNVLERPSHPSAKPAPGAQPRPKAAKQRVSYAKGLAKTSFKELLEETVREDQQAPAQTGSQQAPAGKAPTGSLRDRLANIDDARGAEPPIEPAPQPQATASRRFFRPKRK